MRASGLLRATRGPCFLTADLWGGAASCVASPSIFSRKAWGWAPGQWPQTMTLA